MILTVNPGHHDPPYQQIRLQILTAVTAGALAAGARLPTIRQLANDLDLAANTVARAYRELEADGAIESRGRRGTFVRDANLNTSVTRSQQLDALARTCVAEARRLGAPAPDIAAAVARALTTPTS